MPVTPTKLREVLGEEALNELLLLLEDKALDGRREILTRLEIVEHDVTSLKQEIADLRTDFREFRREVSERFDHMASEFNARFDRVNERFDRINERFDRMASEFNARFDRMHAQMGTMLKWTVGTLALFGTLITTLLALGQFLGP